MPPKPLRELNPTPELIKVQRPRSFWDTPRPFLVRTTQGTERKPWRSEVPYLPDLGKCPIEYNTQRALLTAHSLTAITGYHLTETDHVDQDTSLTLPNPPLFPQT